MRRRRSHSAAFKRQVVEEASVAGVSVASVARRHGLNANMVHMWRRDFRASATCDDAAAFLPVMIEEPDSIPASEGLGESDSPCGGDLALGTIELSLPDGIRLQIPHDAAEAFIARVIRAARTAS